MAIDRAALLRNAEKLLRQGKLDAAIAEYVRVVEDQPHDWNTANVLGDLFLRAGRSDKAVEQFVRAALVLTRDGFLPKAAAVYKRILKIRPEDEHAMQQAGEIAAKQGVLVDARAYLLPVAEKRAARGDAAGAQEIRGRLFDAYLTAGDLDRAREFASTPEHAAALGQGYAARGDAAAAAEFMVPASGDADPELLMKIAQAKIASGAVDEGLGMLRQLVNQDARRGGPVAAFAWDLAPASPDVALRITEIVGETAMIEADWPAAAAVFQELVGRAPHHVPSLQRLVEICFDGGLDAALCGAQAQLAEAYLVTGAPAEARVVAEDLLARDRTEPRHVDLLRRALTMLGEPDVEGLIEERLRSDEAPAETPVEAPAEFPPPPVAEPPAPAAVEPAPAAERPPEPARSDAIEIDLSTLLSDFHVADVPVPAEPPARPDPPPPPRDLDEVFERFREEALTADETARSEYDRAVALREAGRAEESMQAFERASREPMLRFLSCAAIAALHRERDDRHRAIEWLERAAQAPPPTADEGYALFYELAGMLESLGEVERALAVCLELEAEAGAYRDTREHIARLTRVQARG